MKWILYIAVAVAALVAIVAVIGLLLPKTHTATRRARYRQPPEAIYAAISGPPDWRPDVKKYEELPAVNGRKRWREVTGWGDAVLYELQEADPPRRLVTRIADDSLPYGGTWNFEITPDATGSGLRITENGEVRNPIFRFLSRTVFSQTATIETYLRSLATKFGETAVIEK
jgi:hypothetical protein